METHTHTHRRYSTYWQEQVNSHNPVELAEGQWEFGEDIQLPSWSGSGL